MTPAARTRVLIAASLLVCVALPLLHTWSTRASAPSAGALRSALDEVRPAAGAGGYSGIADVLLPIALTIAGCFVVMLFGVVVRFRPSKTGASAERSKAVNQSSQPSPEPEEMQPTSEAYVEVGERVGAVLTSAHNAAEQMLDAARREAEKIRAEAERYRTETRRQVDEEAARRRAEVGEETRGIRQDAVRKANDVLAEAARRQKALVEEAGRSEARLEQLLTVFRGMTSQLEELVEPERDSDAPAQDGLEEALSPERSQARND